jgi:hypothetical protein
MNHSRIASCSRTWRRVRSIANKRAAENHRSRSALAAEPVDLFSRANCFNNESITYNFFDPPETRFVSSFHSLNGNTVHYVTENPIFSCRPGLPGEVTTVSGQVCLYTDSTQTRHAAVHGLFSSSEPNPDGNLFPGVTSAWSVRGFHVTVVPGVGDVGTVTDASDCNLHFDQFY